MFIIAPLSNELYCEAVQPSLVTVTNGDKGEKGEKGDTGSPATLVTKSVTYQVGDFGSIIPSGAWVSSVPVVSQGKYLWTKMELRFNTGDPIISYSVARMGMDGSGAVSSVAGVSPDATGNVTLTAADVGALPSSGGDMTGAINMNGQPLSGLNDPTEETQAARKGYVDSRITSVAVTLPASAWASNLQTVTALGVTADTSKTDVIASPDPADDNYTAYNECGVKLFAQLDGAVQFKCTDTPQRDLTVNLMVRR